MIFGESLRDSKMPGSRWSPGLFGRAAVNHCAFSAQHFHLEDLKSIEHEPTVSALPPWTESFASMKVLPKLLWTCFDALAKEIILRVSQLALEIRLGLIAKAR